MLNYSMERAHDFRVTHREAKGKECSHVAHIYILNPRTNKEMFTSVILFQQLFVVFSFTVWIYIEKLGKNYN